MRVLGDMAWNAAHALRIYHCVQKEDCGDKKLIFVKRYREMTAGCLREAVLLWHVLSQGLGE